MSEPWPVALYAALAVALIVVAGLSLLVGPAGLSPAAVFQALVAPDQAPAAIIVYEIRLPRTLLGAMVGASLGLGGAALQGLLRNPLAEPGIVGTSGSAALGASLAFYYGLADAGVGALPLSGMAGALIAVALLFALAGRDASPLTLILAGVAISSFAGALTALAVNLAPSPYAALEITFWLLGSLSDRSFDHVTLAGPFMVAGWALMASCGRGLGALSLGDDTARTMGVALGQLRLRLMLGIALAVGAAVSVSGTVGFVGLVVPHLLRPLVAHQPGRLLGASALGGAVLVIAADIAARALSSGIEIRLGVVTALIGAPFFLMLIFRLRGGLS